jgi:DNA-binding response OmpR family regulator
MLPNLTGDEILTQIRTKNIHTPVLMLTAKGQTEDKVEMLNTGADDYLTKPFAFSELVARIKALGRRPQKSLDNELRVKDLTLNTQTYEVKRANKEIKLSSKEFSLLEYLMRHPGKIVKKDQIIMQVWSYESDILPNSVEVYIKHLRDKIDKPFTNKPNLIHTIRGFGYKIN